MFDATLILAGVRSGIAISGVVSLTYILGLTGLPRFYSCNANKFHLYIHPLVAMSSDVDRYRHLLSYCQSFFL